MKNALKLLAATAAAASFACGGGGGSTPPAPSSAPALSGTAAAGAPITGAMNGVVLLRDASTPAKTATTPTDASGQYAFTAAQLQGFVPPFMLQIRYEVGGVKYYLHSAVTAEDATSGSATINITPLTDLVIANLAHQIAADVFANASYASLLTKDALDGGVAALDAVLQPVLQQMGVAAGVDLLRQSFTANGQGLDAVLDALRVTIDPVSGSETITNSLNGSTVSGTLAAPPTTPVAAGGGDVSDLQGIVDTFQAFGALMATAPAPTDPALLAFFDATGFKDQGQGLSAFLQEITSNPGIAGGALTLTDVVLRPVPAFVTAVPATATAAYLVSFTALQNAAPRGRHDFVMYKGATGWRILGDQLIAKLEIAAFEGDNGGSYCTGMQLNVGDKGGVGIDYAVVTGPGLPAAGVLLFKGNAGSFDLASGGPSSYAGTSTPGMNGSCYNNVYQMSDQQILTIGALPAVYTVALYSDAGTPLDRSDDALLATYHPRTLSAPLPLASLTPDLFPTAIRSTPGLAATAQGGGQVTLSWTAPSASGLYGSSLNAYVCGATGCDNLDVQLSSAQTSATLTVPAEGASATAGATVEYVDSVFRNVWANPAGGTL